MTLAETVEAVETTIAQRNLETEGHPELAFGVSDTLMVPEMMWRVVHRFRELEGRVVENESYKGHVLRQMRQDIAFKLDRSGAVLSSSWITYMYLCPPAHYAFDRPFLLYLKKRSADRPYFVMWVENAELLNPWNPALAKP